MSYFVLIEKGAGPNGKWAVQFGDNDKECVQAELDDFKDHGTPAKCLKIVKFARVPSQKAINDKVAEFNK